MGSSSSPGLASRYGLSFLRLLRERFAEFNGVPVANCWWTGFSEDGTYDPDLGYGLVYHGEDGPAVLLWVHVDDFAIHGPTYEKTARGLRLFLDTAVDVGLLCHPGKLTPPSQVVKYCGFLLDTRAIPCLRIPQAKRERALAMVQYLLRTPPSHPVSRLSLAVIIGTLESLVDATPQGIGRTILREAHQLLRPPELGTGLAPYLTTTVVPSEVRVQLRRWEALLMGDCCRVARAARSGVLVPTHGDGSGTGTGGTVLFPDQPLDTWMGAWSPYVWHHTSNWKELRTLLLTLQRIIADPRKYASVFGCTLFYFTDNEVTYYIVSAGTSPTPALHELAVQIKALEIQLQVSLAPVHIPGLVMIEQGTDGLSRGVWMSQLHSYMDQRALTSAVFSPLQVDLDLVRATIDQFRLLSPWFVHPWDAPMDTSACLHSMSVWFPPPEIARQLVSNVLELWVEAPLTTAALFFIPRILKGQWQGLHHSLVELTVLQPREVPLKHQPLLPIPFVVLYLPPHTRSVSPLRLGSVASGPNLQWHRQQAEYVRGLSPTVFLEGESTDVLFWPQWFYQ